MSKERRAVDLTRGEVFRAIARFAIEVSPGAETGDYSFDIVINRDATARVVFWKKESNPSGGGGT